MFLSMTRVTVTKSMTFLRIKVKGLNGKFRRHPEGTWAKETNGTYSRVQDDVEEELEQRFDCSVTMSFYLYIMFS